MAASPPRTRASAGDRAHWREPRVVRAVSRSTARPPGRDLRATHGQRARVRQAAPATVAGFGRGRAWRPVLRRVEVETRAATP